MAVIAALIGVAAVVLGLESSLWLDTPSGPSVVVGAAALFALSLLPLPAPSGASSGRA
jgi:zinc transport system permease protein